MFAKYFLPFQFAIGISGGVEIITQLIQTAIFQIDTCHDPNLPPLVILQIDFANMFNSVSRAAARQALLKHFPSLVWLFDQLYPKEGNKIWYQKPNGVWDSFMEREGFAQGCPLSPFFCCLVLSILLEKLHQIFPEVEPLAYMDDNHSIMPANTVKAYMDAVQEFGPPLGLIPHDNKNHLLVSTQDIIPSFQSPPLRQDLQYVITKYFNNKWTTNGLKILGTPCGWAECLVLCSLHSCMVKANHISPFSNLPTPAQQPPLQLLTCIL